MSNSATNHINHQYFYLLTKSERGKRDILALCDSQVTNVTYRRVYSPDEEEEEDQEQRQHETREREEKNMFSHVIKQEDVKM